MKTNGCIHQLLATRCLNDAEYGHRVIWPLLDYLVHHGDLPLVTIEGEPTARQFEIGFKQAKNYSRNFKPRQRNCPMQERTVPFLITAAGSRAEMCRAEIRGLNVEYVPLVQNGLPAFLEWHELLEQAEAMQPTARIRPDRQVLVADAANQFFRDLYGPIAEVARLRDKDDQRVMLFNQLIDLARLGEEGTIATTCAGAGLGRRAVRKILAAIGWYKRKIESDELTGAAVARGYRNFLLQPGGRGGHHFFTGETQFRPYRVRGVTRYRNVARYFTPTEVISLSAEPSGHRRTRGIAKAWTV